ncbi:DUF2231 domain-containing protein [Hydrogenimonas urashimensis]|uniref:DUF2231 domain-containing protein n=1 Tax=Hydrogenimonas urashimensis TaxID=2740515 RepID=UPI00191615AE|nr:DUF2231 domain-containing protein [Hydrogenimonas urashimensis]
MNVLHPPFVHFVIALPLAAFFSQVTYLATLDKTYSKAATRILALSLLISLFALYGGFLDAEKILADHDILEKGVAVLNSHKTFGFIVVGFLALTTFLKWLATNKDLVMLEKISLLLIILTIIATLYQGNHGGSLVYKYSAGIDNRIVNQRVEESQKNWEN